MSAKAPSKVIYRIPRAVGACLLPSGGKKSDLDVQVKGRTVRLAGERIVGYPEKAALHRRERLAGRFDRR